MSSGPSTKRHYFVDEGGDPILFNRRKQIVVGQAVCSEYFVLGLVDIDEPSVLVQELSDLRRSLLADPYFKHVPSMQPEQRKTTRAFHAKDDVPEVRREVFNLIVRHSLRFFAVVRDKRRIAGLVRKHNESHPEYRYHPNQLYDRCVSRLFRDRLHKDDAYRIEFARRGSSDRTTALRVALENARNNFRKKWGVDATSPIEVLPSSPVTQPCLQVADYRTWTVQRLYERRESRFLEFVWPKVALVHDVDDVRLHEYGEYYTQRKPLTVEVLKKE